MIVRAADRSHLDWIASRAKLCVSPTMDAIEAVDDLGTIKGMVAYDGWTPNAVHMHIALEDPSALRRLLKPAFGIPFIEFGRNVALAVVLSTNHRSLKMVAGLGFVQTGLVKDGWEPGVDLIMFEMRKENCRWVKRRNRHV